MGEKVVSAWSKIEIARMIIIQALLEEIIDIILDEDRPLLTITFKKGFVLHIRYNDYYEYSYQILFSQKKNDFLRYDNFDDRWNVPSRPHHLHLPSEQEAIISPMMGKPEKDIPILIKKIKDFL